MGRQDSHSRNNNSHQSHGNDPTMVSSSIALLQERFRQLEKVKERREGKELLKLFSSSSSSSSSSNTAMHLRGSDYSSSLQQRLVQLPLSHTPPLHDSLSLGLHMPSRHGDHSTFRTPSNSDLWSEGASASSFEHSDVDTSLHL